MNDYHNWTEADYLHGGKYMYPRPRWTIFNLMLYVALVCLTTGGVSLGLAYSKHYIQDLKERAATCEAKALR